jgi:hypothetical protein
MSGTTKRPVTKPTQLERVMGYLRKHPMTQAQARTWGIMSLSSRVNELRQAGEPITSTVYTNRQGRKVVRYQLEA